MPSILEIGLLHEEHLQFLRRRKICCMMWPLPYHASGYVVAALANGILGILQFERDGIELRNLLVPKSDQIWPKPKDHSFECRWYRALSGECLKLGCKISQKYLLWSICSRNNLEQQYVVLWNHFDHYETL